MNLEELLRSAIEKGASDVHLKAGIVPVIRRHGTLRPLSKDIPALTGESIREMAESIMDDRHRAQLENNQEIDIGFGISGVGRFRVNIFKQRGTVRMVIRNIPDKVPTIADLNLPEVMTKIANLERGLVLVTGVTGSGKSSTLASLVDHINRHKNKHILTIEDPIEYLIRDRKSLITQRELGMDSHSFAGTLRAAMRQDPDVILVGEMRDKETIEIAMLAAETGHLVLSTLHTMDASETINRILAAFPPQQQQQIRLQLGSVLRAVVSQRLAKRKHGKGSVPAVEILINNARTKEMIENPLKTKELHHAIEEGNVTYGMQSFDQSLMGLLTQDIISYEEALQLSTSPEDFAIRYKGVNRVESKNWADSTEHNAKIVEDWLELDEVEIDDIQDREEDAHGEPSKVRRAK